MWPQGKGGGGKWCWQIFTLLLCMGLMVVQMYVWGIWCSFGMVMVFVLFCVDFRDSDVCGMCALECVFVDCVIWNVCALYSVSWCVMCSFFRVCVCICVCVHLCR